MDIAYSLCLLEGNDTTAAYQALKELEALSASSNALYPYAQQFVSMVSSEHYTLRVRGFRLLSKQAKWDVDDVIDNNLDAVLHILNDEKPTAVRQALAALHEVVLYKPNLHEKIRQRVCAIDYLRYKDTMHSLIAKDIAALLKAMDEAEI